MNFPSKLLEGAVDEFSRLPGIGRRTALRLVLHLLKQDPAEVQRFGETILRMQQGIGYCRKCHSITESDYCTICSDQKRDAKIVCVVQDIRDVIAIESTAQYRGLYHVLGGIISPMEGVGPQDLNTESLIARVQGDGVTEIVMALSATLEGDTTVFYLYKRLKDFGVKISVISRGVAVGNELEYADEITLGRSIVNRVPYENTLAK
jgi:recombination protein RecR